MLLRSSTQRNRSMSFFDAEGAQEVEMREDPKQHSTKGNEIGSREHARRNTWSIGLGKAPIRSGSSRELASSLPQLLQEALDELKKERARREELEVEVAELKRLLRGKAEIDSTEERESEAAVAEHEL